MQFSVVIPTCNRPALLAVCLERLAPGAQSLAAAEYEVIVTDDGTDEPIERQLASRFPWVRWTTGPRSGPAANRNHGATLAEGEWLAFTDDDCVPDVTWLAGFAAAARARRDAVQVLEGRTYVDCPRTHPLEFSPINQSGGNLWSCNFAIRRRLFGELGGFDCRFPFNAMEDAELKVRLAQRRIEPEFVPTASVLHPWRRIDDWSRHAARHMASRLIMESIHPGAGFPVSAWRAARVHGRTVLKEHLPWLMRRPLTMIQVLPVVWRTMAEDVWITRRQRARIEHP